MRRHITFISDRITLTEFKLATKLNQIQFALTILSLRRFNLCFNLLIVSQTLLAEKKSGNTFPNDNNNEKVSRCFYEYSRWV